MQSLDDWQGITRRSILVERRLDKIFRRFDLLKGRFGKCLTAYELQKEAFRSVNMVFRIFSIKI